MKFLFSSPFAEERKLFPRPSSAGQNAKTSGQQVTPASAPETKRDPSDRDSDRFAGFLTFLLEREGETPHGVREQERE